MKEVGTGIGIACLIVAIIAIFIPIYGGYLMGVALLGAALAALFGDKALTIATVATSGLNLWLFSPIVKLAVVENVSGLGLLALILFAAPIVAMYLNSTGKVVLGASRASSGLQ